ncbi:MAG: YaaL family protein [Alkalibacterium sp.]|nr:YaaL family protein [Alkalibacterium sp.]TVP91969.1 MAG: DUF2508 family protein [Alkalibacterium sp.]
MGLFRKKHKLKNAYDQTLIAQIQKQKEFYENAKGMERLMVKEHPKWDAELKLQRAKYFYLFKEARIRNIQGNHLK